MLEFHSITSGVLAFVPAQVRRGCVFLIPEMERIRVVRVSQRRDAVGELECRISAIQRIGAVGAGDVQCSQPVICADIHVLGAHALAEEANVGIQQQARSECIGSANTDRLNQAGCSSWLSAIDSSATRALQSLGIKKVRLLESIAAKDCALAGRIPIQFAVNVVASVFAEAAAK